MRLTSLRSKIFLLVGLTLVLSAVAALLVTQHEVRKTVMTSETVAVRNVLNLLMRGSDARWGGFLDDKITTIRNDRRELMQLGNTVQSVLASYARLAGRDMSVTQAQALAKRWIDNLHIGEERYSFVFDSHLKILAAGKPGLLGFDLSGVTDFKGHPLAASAYQEARTTGHSFAIYRTQGKSGSELRYAYFAYFQPWDWIYAITGNAQEVVAQFAQRRNEMEHAVKETLASLRLAQSGFVFITADDGRLIAPPPAAESDLLDARAAVNGKTLRDKIAATREPGSIEAFHFSGQTRDGTGPWEISTAYFKPLGWTIVAAVPSSDLTRAATALRNRLVAVFVLVLLASLAVAWALTSRIVRPLRRLSRYARTLPEQDLSLPASIPEPIARLPDHQPDEVGRLAATFIYMDKQLREKIARLVEETSSRERFESELHIARDIQMGLLPPPLSGLADRIDLHATMIPAREVGGDLYDYFLLPDGRLCLAIGDVSDKGMPAALFMAVTRTLIRASTEGETDPGQVMARVNNRLAENNPNLMFVTLVLAILDLRNGALSWSNAGHLHPCILDAGSGLRRLTERGGPACGIQEGLVYASHTTRLEAGETFVGYTDGVTEALDPEGGLYGEQRLCAVLRRQTASSAQGIAEAILDNVRDFAQGTEQSDDITLIAARRPMP